MRFCMIAKDGESQPKDARLILADERFNRILVTSDALRDQPLSRCVDFRHAFYRIHA